VFSKTLNQIEDKVFSIILTNGDHLAVSGWWAGQIARYGGTANMRAPQIKAAFRKVYKDYPEILKLEEVLFKAHF
jgi:hypothetical protein